MRSLLVALAVCGPAPLARAQDLIPNPSFEQATGCPAFPGEIVLAAPWIAPTAGTADYFSACNVLPDSLGVPGNAVGNQAAFAGTAYAGIISLSPPMGNPEYREYIQTPLLGGGLEAGKTYRFTMHLGLAEDSSAATDRIGAYFSTTAVGSAMFDALPFTPQLETPAGTFLDDTALWMTFTDTYVAAGGEAFVTIGNFHDFASSATIAAGFGPDPPLQLGTAYYYVDVVSLECETCVEPPDDLVGWWPLDETSGITAYDVVGAQHGLHVDGPAPVPGYVDGSLDFLGSCVSVATSAGTELGTLDFTLDAWVRPAALGTQQALFVKLVSLVSLTEAGYALALNADGTVTFTMVDSSLGVATGVSSAVLPIGVWSHVTVTVDRDDPAGGKIHVDGDVSIFDPTTAPLSLSTEVPLLFARDGGAGVGDDLVGGLDEVELFHRALTEAEVLALYQARTSGKCKLVLEIEPVTGVEATPGGTIGTIGTLTNSTGTTGTFTFDVLAAAAGTKCGLWTSTVDGPQNPVVQTQQPLRVGPGQSAAVRFELDVPPDLVDGEVACYEVTTTHVETGRTFRSLGVLRARNRKLAPGSPTPQDFTPRR